MELAPVHAAQVDWANAQQWKGVAILGTAGRVLGVTSAVSSVITLGANIFDGDGEVSTLHVIDAAISVGSLLVKSNAVGFVISGGWLLIKGEFEE